MYEVFRFQTNLIMFFTYNLIEKRKYSAVFHHWIYYFQCLPILTFNVVRLISALSSIHPYIKDEEEYLIISLRY